MCVFAGGALLAQTAREVTATRSGWRPPVLNAKKGEAVNLLLKTEDGQRCFAIDELRIEKRIVPGRPTRFDLTPDRAGVFAYHCCLESGEKAARERGQLTVAE
jgi:heme/copper-type cytochrome/quinol oxidase subunit 2